MAIIDIGIRTAGRSAAPPEAVLEPADPSNPDRPPRPKSLEFEDLGFTRRERMVRWMSPKQLLATAVKVLVSSFFGAYSDKREIQAGLPSTDPVSYADEPGVDERGVWVDYVADLGDGFGPTYSVASLLARPDLPLAHAGGRPETTSRGRMLVMGGDQVYPVASTIEYRDRTLGPYQAALPYHPPATAPDLFAIPGNHDWYDGLTSFMRIFCREDWIGGWRTRQRRSYFAVQPRHNWWLWGIDIQFDSYIDQPQFEYFEKLAKSRLKRGDSVVLCSSVPSWVKANQGKKPEHPEAFATLDYFERKIIRSHGADVRLSLAGDTHHYARYVAEDGAQRITAGGGGAYLSATHDLPETLVLPPKERGAGKSKDPVLFELETAYPEKATSKKLRWRVLALPFRNRSMWALIGTVQLLLAWMFHVVLSSGLTTPTGIHAATFVLCLAIVGGVSGFTKSKVPWKRAVGAVHGLIHLALTVAVIDVASTVLHRLEFEHGWFLAGLVVLVGVGGGLLGSWLLAAYLLFADRWLHCNANELFAAQRNRDYKNFLRLHFDASGGVTVYPVKVARTPREWRLNWDGGLDDPWMISDQPLEAELIEEPFTIRPLEIGADLEQELAEAGSRAS